LVLHIFGSLLFLFDALHQTESYFTDPKSIVVAAEASLRYIIRIWIDVSGTAVDYDSQLLSI